MSEKGFVYFMKVIGGDAKTPTKIGIAKDIYQRLSSVQTGCPYELKIVGWIESEDYKELERMLHVYLEGVRMRGEWFMMDNLTIRKVLGLFHRSSVVFG